MVVVDMGWMWVGGKKGCIVVCSKGSAYHISGVIDPVRRPCQEVITRQDGQGVGRRGGSS